MFPGLPPGFDPSKLDPKLIAEISELMSSLPPAMMVKMQSLMHNSMAGFDVKKEMEEFERGLPPGFREKMARIMYRADGVVETFSTDTPTDPTSSSDSSLHADSVNLTQAKPIESVSDARLTILRAVKDGTLSPEAALQALFS